MSDTFFNQYLLSMRHEYEVLIQAVIFLSDIPECASNPCRNGGSCNELINGYNCSCPERYGGVNCEKGESISVFFAK